MWPSRGFLFFLRLSWLQLVQNRNSPRDLQVGARVRQLLCGSDVYRQSRSLWGWVLVIGCLNWCMWGGWKGSEANQEKFVWKEVCLPFWGRGNGEGMWSRTSKAGRLMKLRGFISQTASAGPGLQSMLCLHLSHVLTCLWVKLLRQPQQLGPGKQPRRYVDPLAKFCLFSLINVLHIYWTLSIFQLQGIQPWTQHTQVLLSKTFQSWIIKIFAVN